MDLEAERAKLPRIAQNQNADARRNLYAEMQIAALLDIAESLRVLAMESHMAMQPASYTVNGHAPEPEDDTVPFDIGDVVYVEGIDGPAEITGFRSTEGSTFATLQHGDEALGLVDLSLLHRLTGDEGDEPDPLGGVSIGRDEEILDARFREENGDLVDEADEALAHTPLSTEPETDFDVDPLEVVKRKAKSKKKAAEQ